MSCKVFLVGAGPGDPELLTIKGMRCLRQAEVVLYDRLANPVLLDYAPAEAVRINVGKAPQRHRLSQEKINATLIGKAQLGLRVVRLKGGDPFVFGRGGEEALALARAGISYEVVPGISSALAVPAYAGIPVTQRRLSQAFTVVTGHTAAGTPSSVDWSALPLDGTLVILMGVRSLPKIAPQLCFHGRPTGTPAAVIAHGTTPQQRVIIGTLGDIAARASDVRPPAITVVGEVVRLHQALAWFQEEPLSQFGT